MTEVFVFGSNLAGRHGAGSAREAYLNHGASYGIGKGRCGNSYAIPTKDKRLSILPLYVIKQHVEVFLQYAHQHPDDIFTVVSIGCGLAGYVPEQIAPMFRYHPRNVRLTKEFELVLAGIKRG